MKPVETLVELAEISVSMYRDRPIFGERTPQGWQWTTYDQWHAQVVALRGALTQLGVGRGDRVALVSRNSAAWASVAYATYGLGATLVPIYETQRPADWEFILRDCNAKVVFARTQEMADAIEDMVPRLPALREVIAIEGGLAVAEAWGRENPAPISSVAGTDVADLIYTAGTTGLPKGAILTHRNLMTTVAALRMALPLTPDDRTLSFVPWAHVYNQTCELHFVIASGASSALSDPDRLDADLREIQPTVLVAVPRVFDELYAEACAQIDRKSRPIRWLLSRALDAAIERNHGVVIGVLDRIALLLASLWFARMRRKLGGRLRYAISGGAMLSREVVLVIDGLGIVVYQGYGMTEAPVIALDRSDAHKLGTVGKPLHGVVVELDYLRGDARDEGELVVHGPNVTRGYHHRPEENELAFTRDGGFHTGDLGRFDSDGFLVITGRIKDRYTLDSGKCVMPVALEHKLALSPYITNVMLYGADRPYNVALVAIDPVATCEWATREGVELGDDLTTDPRVRDLILKELARNARRFRAFERPVDFVVIATPFTPDNGLLTPTLELVRREVVARYGGALDALFETRPRAVTPRATGGSASAVATARARPAR